MLNSRYNKYEQVDAFEEVAAILSASGVEITGNMLKLMSPLMYDSKSFEERCDAISARLDRFSQ